MGGLARVLQQPSQETAVVPNRQRKHTHALARLTYMMTHLHITNTNTPARHTFIPTQTHPRTRPPDLYDDTPSYQHPLLTHIYDTRRTKTPYYYRLSIPIVYPTSLPPVDLVVAMAMVFALTPPPRHTF